MFMSALRLFASSITFIIYYFLCVPFCVVFVLFHFCLFCFVCFVCKCKILLQCAKYSQTMLHTEIKSYEIFFSSLNILYFIYFFFWNTGVCSVSYDTLIKVNLWYSNLCRNQLLVKRFHSVKHSLHFFQHYSQWHASKTSFNRIVISFISRQKR